MRVHLRLHLAQVVERLGQLPVALGETPGVGLARLTLLAQTPRPLAIEDYYRLRVRFLAIIIGA